MNGQAIDPATKADPRVQLAYERTFLAYERTGSPGFERR
jgi:uncharacterized membrane protein YidH (DUF202 family)